jgi:hypothetical protein
VELLASLIEEERREIANAMLKDGLRLVVSVHSDHLGNLAVEAPQAGAELTAGLTARGPEGDQQETFFLEQHALQLLGVDVPQFSLSITMAIPWPPPTHIVSSP